MRDLWLYKQESKFLWQCQIVLGKDHGTLNLIYQSDQHDSDSLSLNSSTMTDVLEKYVLIHIIINLINIQKT